MMSGNGANQILLIYLARINLLSCDLAQVTKSY